MTILKSKTVRIGLLGMYTSRNLGDVAIQHAIMNALRKRREDIEFVGLCQDPEDTVRAFGIPAVASTGFGSRLFPLNGTQPMQPAQLPAVLGKKLSDDPAGGLGAGRSASSRTGYNQARVRGRNFRVDPETSSRSAAAAARAPAESHAAFFFAECDSD